MYNIYQKNEKNIYEECLEKGLRKQAYWCFQLLNFF